MAATYMELLMSQISFADAEYAGKRKKGIAPGIEE